MALTENQEKIAAMIRNTIKEMSGCAMLVFMVSKYDYEDAKKAAQVVNHENKRAGITMRISTKAVNP